MYMHTMIDTVNSLFSFFKIMIHYLSLLVIFIQNDTKFKKIDYLALNNNQNACVDTGTTVQPRLTNITAMSKTRKKIEYSYHCNTLSPFFQYFDSSCEHYPGSTNFQNISFMLQKGFLQMFSLIYYTQLWSVFTTDFTNTLADAAL